MHWCEVHVVDYVIGLAKNERLTKHIAPELAQAQTQCQQTEAAARVFADFRYRTRKSWSRERRVVGKAEHLPAGANPRFVVTSLSPDTWAAQALYEDFYCARGDMENRIKEQQLALFADRTSSATLRANQLRLYWATLAYVLLQQLRDRGLAGTRLARAQCDTLRLRLLKIGAHVPRHRAPHLRGAVRAGARRRPVHHGRSAFALNAQHALTIGQAAADVRDYRGHGAFRMWCAHPTDFGAARTSSPASRPLLAPELAVQDPQTPHLLPDLGRL